MIRAIEILAMIQLLLVGLSHLFRPLAWVEFFSRLRGWGDAGILVHGLLSLGLGSLVLAFHPVWHGAPLVLTLVGCLYLLKAALCFLFPATQRWSLARVSPERSGELRLAGAGMTAVGVLLAIILVRT